MPTSELEVMRAWSVANPDTIGDFERIYPGSLVGPCFVGQTAARGELVYDGAEPADVFLPGATGRRG